MASHLRDDVLYGRDHPDTHASANRWRHQESGSFARHVAPREADERGGSKDLAEFLNTTRLEPPKSAGSGGRFQPIMVAGNVQNGAAGMEGMDAQNDGAANTPSTYGSLDVRCGPLLNYRRMENKNWYGSVLIVTRGGGLRESPVIPELHLRFDRARLSQEISDENANGVSTEAYGVVNGVDYRNGHQEEAQQHEPINGTGSNGTNVVENGSGESKISGTKLYSDPSNTFWRFDLKVPMQKFELHCHYEIPGLSFETGEKNDKQSFFVPAISQSMRIMFHSCNGFSVGTDEEAWSGAALWNDVIRVHKRAPFHVMLGGGDQIYNDGIRVNGPLRPWTDIGNPIKRREFPFPEDLRKKCDEYYVENYIRWYGTEPFASANGQIAQLNLWDDHDIIDGFGSYVDEFMRCSVFRGIGGTANKYYLLFQHHLAPPLSTYTTDAPQTTSDDGVGTDPRQLENTFVLQEENIDSSYIIGSKPGPYVAEHSRSIYARLGARIAFFGIDARTERTRKQVNYPETYEIIFTRLRKELAEAKASSTPIQHLVVLLGIPIAYPRLTWLENIFSSPLIAPIKFLNKRFGFGGSFFNHFDGSVDLLDDLDDHYTARTHKKERLFIVQQLQALSAEFSVRISILGGDVHLAAVGRFYSNPKLNVPVAQDHRYMANIISSAIVNKPPPQAVANLLARRNKIHHLDQNTDETLMNYFDRDPGTSNKTANFNHVTMPSRNWAMITENAAAMVDGNVPNGHSVEGDSLRQLTPPAKDGHSCLHDGEVNAGTKHKAADEAQHGLGSDGSLDVTIRVEKDQHSKEGLTEHYGMTIPLLAYDGAAENTLRKRDAIHGAVAQRIPM
ncbi:uncharacterized protein LY89DRAFT_682032 [Mollisia scopiformis]|uniref:PhoD-like phosphatase domain-containing protein n=1 Tax=Mollisia scopiformis TaxID=149040 RepID=A0A194XJG8_MOLSC|nr:uncharacterized protein LY89DRAFT_682032 [Mollisia scopiformis]KUJ20274.1 hypothetical protein LY89DRAFT_682032 [Mollisia scopiformis]